MSLEQQKLDKKSLDKIDRFIESIDDNSDYFTISDGQSKLINFDLENSVGFQKRILYLSDGSEKAINQFTFVVILRNGKKQVWDLSSRFAK